ncbi:Unknown protein sequence [Pseudomonas syringae pv. cilantro]|uniref:Uncharacterized protein n=1 Tax=Pseudomonas syringae pv. cilantro TaxID=81035 RepID=A0A0N0GGN4_PSESX|nr:Unknown protein sequence [Pseudomonas syringae pv. cilantro]
MSAHHRTGAEAGRSRQKFHTFCRTIARETEQARAFMG